MTNQQVVKVMEASQPEPINPLVMQQERHMKLLELAFTQKADITTIEKLVELQERYEAKEAKKAFYAALSSFQANMPVVKKQGRAGFQHKQGGGSTSYSYAKLEDIAKAARPHLAVNGLSYRYEQECNGNQITVHCIVSHKMGHQERTSMTGFADASGKKNPIQQIASTQSYLRRYTFTGVIGITVADEDDDAQAVTTQAHERDEQGYSWNTFNANLPKWEAALKEGKITHDKIIDMCNTKSKLCNEQVNIIKQIIPF